MAAVTVGADVVRSAAMVASGKGVERHQVARTRAKRPLASQRGDLRAAGIVAAVSEVRHPSTRQRELVMVVVASA